MIMKGSTFLLLICYYIVPQEGAKVLLIVPMVPGMYSHVTTMADLGQGLLERGHQVSWIVPRTSYLPAKFAHFFEMPLKKVYYQTNDSDFSQAVKLEEEVAILELKSTSDTMINDVLSVLSPIVANFHNLALSDRKMLEELKKEQYDLVIIDNLFLHRNFYLIPAKLGVPFISIADSMEPWMARVPWLPSYIPHSLLGLSDKMTFLQRVGNTVFNIIWTVFPSLYDVSLNDEVRELYSRELAEHGSVHNIATLSEYWLITSNKFIDYPKPVTANMVNIGGHNTRPAKELKPELKAFLDAADQGAIVVSFGSAVETFPPNIVHKFMETFKQIPQKVVMRLKEERTEENNIPANVKLLKWLPQNDLLAHPAVKLFITHCGRNGQFEALYHAKPMIAMAVQNEQMYNAKRVVRKGFGVEVDLKSFTSEELLEAIKEILKNPEYTQKISKASRMFRNQQIHPMNVAIYNVEHVLEYGGAYLRSYGQDMPWYQFLLLDVLALIFVILAIMLIITFKFIKYLVRKLCCRKKIKTE